MNSNRIISRELAAVPSALISAHPDRSVPEKVIHFPADKKKNTTFEQKSCPREDFRFKVVFSCFTVYFLFSEVHPVISYWR